MKNGEYQIKIEAKLIVRDGKVFVKNVNMDSNPSDLGFDLLKALCTIVEKKGE